MVEIKRYIKKPIPVEAYQYTMDHFIGVVKTPGVSYDAYDRPYIKTLEGEMTFCVGDYVCKGIDGEYWVVKKHIFERTYEEINSSVLDH